MKKILLIIPIIGICSSLLAQAPKVENVDANQKEGTKCVIIKADLSGKGSEPMAYCEVWFKLNPSDTQWLRVDNLKTLYNEFEDPNTAPELPANEGYDSGTSVKLSYHINGLTEAPSQKIFVWDAGAQSSDYQSENAIVKVILFYPKKDEFGTPEPSDQQSSGWDGFGVFSASSAAGGS